MAEVSNFQPWDGKLAMEKLNEVTYAAESPDLAHAVRNALVSNLRFCIIKDFDRGATSDSELTSRILTACRSIGDPTPTDKSEGRLLWSVKPLQGQASGFLTYSQHQNEADLHTDTQYFPHPEPIMSLWCLRPASDPGGVSRLVDGRMVVSRLMGRPDGESLHRVLSETSYPFFVPPVFRAKKDELEVEQAPILGTCPLIRYRRQTIEQALSEGGLELSHDQRDAMMTLDEEINNPDLAFDMKLQAGDALVVNNHEILHGRTAFLDMDRHLVRVRMRHLSL